MSSRSDKLWRGPGDLDLGVAASLFGSGLGLWAAGRLGYPDYLPSVVAGSLAAASVGAGASLLSRSRDVPPRRETGGEDDSAIRGDSRAGDGVHTGGDPDLRNVQRLLGTGARLLPLRLAAGSLRWGATGRLDRYGLILTAESAGMFAKPEKRAAVAERLENAVEGQWVVEFKPDKDLVVVSRKIEFPEQVLVTERPLIAWSQSEAMAMYSHAWPSVGIDNLRRPIRIDFKKAPHMLVLGGTGSGKSVTSRWLVEQLRAAGWIIVALDGKRTDFSALQGAANVLGVSAALHEHVLMVHLVRQELDRRRAVGRRRRGLGEAGWNVFPPMLVIADEFAAIRLGVEGEYAKRDQRADPFLDDLSEIYRVGREFRIHIVFCTQELYASTISGPWQENIDTILPMGPTGKNTLEYGFPRGDVKDAARRIGPTLPKGGRGIVADKINKTVVEFQGYYAYAYGSNIDDEPDSLVRENWSWIKSSLTDRIPRLYPRTWWKVPGPEVSEYSIPELHALAPVLLDDPKTLAPIAANARWDPQSAEYVGFSDNSAVGLPGGFYHEAGAS